MTTLHKLKSLVMLDGVQRSQTADSVLIRSADAKLCRADLVESKHTVLQCESRRDRGGRKRVIVSKQVVVLLPGYYVTGFFGRLLLPPYEE